MEKKRNIICDTTASPILLNLDREEQEEVMEALVEIGKTKRDNVTISFRISEQELQWFQKKARELSLVINQDVDWQKLLRITALEKYPMGGKKNEKE